MASTHSPPPAVLVEVRLVGVVGCSASGKSTAAHQLARCLHSPLHPIGTDHFFHDDVCAELGTYDDYRCLNYAKVAHWMKELKQPVKHVCSGSTTEDVDEAWETQAREAWWADVRARLPGIEAYLPTNDSKSPREGAQKAEIISGVRLGCDVGHSGDDESLCAHEAEDAERRDTSNAIAAAASPALPQSLRLSGVDSRGESNRSLTLYVVWEGFTLLCDAAVNACIDAAAAVRCDPETACLRRFFRSPRRHLVQHATRPCREKSDVEGDTDEEQQRQAEAAVVARIVRQLYRPRIEQLWAVRAREAQRVALQGDLAQAMEDAGATSHTPLPSSAAQHVRDLLLPEAFQPPRPGLHHGSASTEVRCGVCWCEDGVPTRAFQHFWESDFEEWLAHAAPPAVANALAWAALRSTPNSEFSETAAGTNSGDEAQHAENASTGQSYVEAVLAERGCHALTSACGRPAQLPQSPLPSAAVLSAALAPFYYEFRYWFFFEVLYNDHLIHPLQDFNLRCTPQSVEGAAAGAVRRWWVLENGRDCQGKSEDRLLHQVQAVALSIISLFEAAGRG